MSFESAPTEEQIPLTPEKMSEEEKSSLWEKVKGSKLATAALSGFMALSTIGCAGMSDTSIERGREMYENNRTARTLRVYSDSYTVGIRNSGQYKIEEHHVTTYRGPDDRPREVQRKEHHQEQRERENNSHRDNHTHSR